ncbi:hypothetical protein E2320_011732, partial [Naja naja]
MNTKLNFNSRRRELGTLKIILLNFSLANMNCTMECWDYNYTTHYLNGNTEAYICTKCIILPVISFTCCIGLTLNGSFIWLLGFHIKRDPFTVFILNLAVADFGYLINMAMDCTDMFIYFRLGIISSPLYQILYINGLFLLAAISIDQILNIVQYVFCYSIIWNLHVFVTALFCLSLIMICTLILFIKICFKSRQIKHRRLLVMTLITVLSSLILNVPFYVYGVIIHFHSENYFLPFLDFEYYFNLSTSLNSSNQTKIVVLPVMFIFCCAGLPLNGRVIWLLGFQMKRNPFTVLILNLAIADLGVLIFMPILAIRYFEVLQLSIISNLICSTLMVYFFWQPSALTGVCLSFSRFGITVPGQNVCPLLSVPFWILSFLLGVIQNIMEYMDPYSNISSLHLVVTAMLCFPLIIISTVILFIKIYMKPEQAKRRRLLVMILITLVCFLILTFPLYVYIVTAHFLHLGYIWDIFQFPSYFYLSACVNSSINPVIYFLVGRKKRAQSKENIK